MISVMSNDYLAMVRAAKAQAERAAKTDGIPQVVPVAVSGPTPVSASAKTTAASQNLFLARVVDIGL